MKKNIYKILSTILVAGLMSTSAFASTGSTNKNLSNNKNTVWESREKKRILNEMEEYYKKNGKGCLNEFDKLNRKQQKELEEAFGGYDNHNIKRSRAPHISIDFNKFHNGSMILVRNSNASKKIKMIGYWHHVGTYSQSQGKFITARDSNLGYGRGVIYEPQSWYLRNYDKGVGIDIKPCNRDSRQLGRMMKWLDYFKGREYSIRWNSKSLSANDVWYCSLLPWKGYKTTFGVDIDYDGGPIVAPDDIINYKPSTIIAKS